MQNITYIIVVLLSFLGAVTIVWLLLSRWWALPCPTWLGWLIEQDNPFFKINQAATIIRHLELQEGMVVLDVGCGPGRVTIPAAHAVGSHGKVVAMDIQAGMLRRTQEKALAANVANIEFLEAGIGEGKLAHNTFDRALLVTVLGEIPDQKTALKEIFDALKPGGVLSVTEIILDPHFQRRSTVQKLASAAGFQEKASFGNCIAYTLNFSRP
jgi:ubiquinone/menaquinone biosynthesis C-methylase UbiE